MLRFFITTALFTLLLLTGAPFIEAADNELIDSEQSGDYYYKVTKDPNNHYMWELGNKEEKLSLEETEQNLNNLEGFRNTVIAIDTHTFNLVLFSCCFLLIIGASLFALKVKPKTKIPKLILLGLSIYTVYQITQNGFDLYEEIQQADFLINALKQKG